jgi:hypothetical protein
MARRWVVSLFMLTNSAKVGRGLAPHYGVLLSPFSHGIGVGALIGGTGSWRRCCVSSKVGLLSGQTRL